MKVIGIGTNELLVILLLAVIILGPERLTKAARQLGKFIRSVRGYFSSLSEELKTELDLLDEIKEVKKDLEG